MQNELKEKTAWAAVIFSPVFLSMLIIGNHYKLILIAFLAPLFFFWAISASPQKLIPVVIVAAFFPLKLHISTTDLSSIALYVCYFCFGIYYFNAQFSNQKIIPPKEIIALSIALLAIATMSTFGQLHNFPIFRTSFWNLILLGASLIFLIFISSLTFTDNKEKHSYVIKWMDIILICTCFQLILGIMVFYFPETGIWFKFFYSSHQTSGIRIADIESGLPRLQSIVLSPESIGEFCAMLIPYACYRWSSDRNLRFLLATLILLLAIFLSGTRSGVILSFFGLLGYYLFIEKSIQRKSIQISILAGAIITALLFHIGTSTITSRFLVSYEQYLAGADAATVLNRKFLFEQNWTFFIDTLSFFGNGLISPVSSGFLRIDFHNIYMTIIYRYGIIGAAFYFCFPFFLMLSQLKAIRNFKTDIQQLILTKVCLLSFLIFIINEMKYEFTRKPDYVLIVWILFSVYYLQSKYFHSKSDFNVNE